MKKIANTLGVIRSIIVGHLCQMPTTRWRFTEWSRWDARDIDGQPVRARERERASQTPYNRMALTLAAACLLLLSTASFGQSPESVAEREVVRRHAGISQGEAALARGDLFVGYLSTYPKLSINHCVLFYARKPGHTGSEIERYLVYDPNHAEAPRELTWSPGERAFAYQKDIDFVGGFVRVYQVYGKWLQ